MWHLFAQTGTEPTSSIRAEIDAVASRLAKELEIAAGWLAKKDATSTVPVRKGTLADETTVRDRLSEQEGKLLDTVKKGPVIVS